MGNWSIGAKPVKDMLKIMENNFMDATPYG